jgi:hypothetical protein
MAVDSRTIVADHGGHIGEHGLLGHVASVYEPLLHVPLLVLGPAELVGRGVQRTQALYQAFHAWGRGEAATLTTGGPVLAEHEGSGITPAPCGARAASRTPPG